MRRVYPEPPVVNVDFRGMRADRAGGAGSPLSRTAGAPTAGGAAEGGRRTRGLRIPVTSGVNRVSGLPTTPPGPYGWW